MRYPTPSNALKRAQELIAVGQGQAALAVLQDVVTSRRSRSAPLSLMEPIVLKFIELAVEQRKGKIAKEGLYQYRNMAQNASVATIETVVTHFIELAEANVQRAQAKAEQVTLDLEDLEASETPEKLMISTVTSDANKDRTDRALVTPWLKFLWETYRTCLDILRNNARLEGLYQTTAHQAFQFCSRYARKAEYRRLCDLLRNHLLNIARSSHQAYAVNLSDPESLQRHLDTRFLQLNAASELELWQEAFRSVEDIHNLLSLSKKPVKPLMQANYYEKLAKIFLTADNLLFHSAAWNKYYMLMRHHSAKLGSPEEQQRLASLFLLSALAVPIISPSKSRGYMQMDESKYKTRRLTDLLNLSRIPTRAGLLKEALNNNVLRKVTPELRELYNILEVEFHPLSICNKIAPIVETLSRHEEYSIYCKPLHDVVLTRLLQQLSQVYTTINLSMLLKLTQFPQPFTFDATDLEKFIMNGCKRGELSIRIDHATNSIAFDADLLAAPKSNAEGPRLQAIPSEQMRTQLANAARSMHAALQLIDPSASEARARAKELAFRAATAAMVEEHEANRTRKAVIERKKEILDTLMMRKEKEEARERAIRMQREAEAEKSRLAEEQKKRELERIRADQEAVRREEARKIAEALKPRGVKLDLEALEDLDKDKLIAIQVDHLEKEKQEVNARLRSIGKKMDHLERAFRRAEIPLLEKDYEQQRKRDAAYYEATRTAILDSARAKRAADLREKERFARMLADYQAYRKSVEERREDEFRERRAAAAAKIEQEKENRRARYRELKAEAARMAEEAERERIRRENEAERERTQREEEERRRKEEAAAIEAERHAKLAKEKEEDAERQRKLAEQSERQRARDAEIERKLAEQSRGLTSSRSTPPTSAEAAASPAASAGKYVPPHRAQGGGASPSLPRRDFSSPSTVDSGSWRRESREKFGTSTTGNDTAAAPQSSSSVLRGSSESLASTGSGSSRPLFGAGKAGGWRDRAARKAQEEAAAKDADGFTEVRRK